MLFVPEALPLDPEPPAPARGAPAPRAEILSEEPVVERPPARHAWLRWLFRPESLEPHP